MNYKEKRFEEVDKLLKSIPESWRYRWCGIGPCACRGCVNISGKVNITKEEWENWKKMKKFLDLEQKCGKNDK
jgi:hypothetical protein